jgi:hypothetical protein
LQVQLYEDFAESKARDDVNESVMSTEQKANPQKATHVFQVKAVMNIEATSLTSIDTKFS